MSEMKTALGNQFAGGLVTICICLSALSIIQNDIIPAVMWAICASVSIFACTLRLLVAYIEDMEGE